MQAFPEGLPPVYLVGAVGEGVSVVPAPPSVLRLWEMLASGPITVHAAIGCLAEGESTAYEEWPADPAAWLWELIGAAAIGCMIES